MKHTGGTRFLRFVFYYVCVSHSSLMTKMIVYTKLMINKMSAINHGNQTINNYFIILQLLEIILLSVKFTSKLKILNLN